MKFCGVVLAAGESTRMGGVRSKVLVNFFGKPMIYYPVKALHDAGAERIVVVTGKDRKDVENALEGFDVEFVHQRQRLGTAHALMQAEEMLGKYHGRIVVIMGDMPLVTSAVIKKLLKENAECVIASTELQDPASYGRIIRSESGEFVKIKEAKDLSIHEREVKEVNTGLYVFSSPLIWTLLKGVKRSNSGEYYLTDVPEFFIERERSVQVLKFSDSLPFTGINSPAELSACEKEIQMRVNESLMNNGVIIHSVETTWISPLARVKKGAEIFPYTFILGASRIESGAKVGSFSYICDSVVKRDATVYQFCHLNGVIVGEGAEVGPFARLRSGTKLGKFAKVGDFVEMKKTIFGDGSKANHLAYLGDAVVGKNVNVGAGVITCNYDGVKKYQTRIGDGAFIGSDSQLVAPVKIGKNAYVGAGSTITKDVPPGALGISRANQKNIKGYARKKLQKKK